MSEEIPCVPDEPRDMAIDCGPCIMEANGVWVAIRDGGTNKTICVTPAGAVQLADKLRHAAGEVG